MGSFDGLQVKSAVSSHLSITTYYRQVTLSDNILCLASLYAVERPQWTHSTSDKTRYVTRGVQTGALDGHCAHLLQYAAPRVRGRTVWRHSYASEV